jgi:hypothetical protein
MGPEVQPFWPGDVRTGTQNRLFICTLSNAKSSIVTSASPFCNRHVILDFYDLFIADPNMPLHSSASCSEPGTNIYTVWLTFFCKYIVFHKKLRTQFIMCVLCYVRPTRHFVLRDTILWIKIGGFRVAFVRSKACLRLTRTKMKFCFSH